MIDKTRQYKIAVATLKMAKKKLLKKKNVVGVGIGYKVVAGKETNDIGIICSVETKESLVNLSKKDKIPEYITNFLNIVYTDVVDTGTIKAHALPTDKWRPAVGGVSCGHTEVTAGTLGCLVKRGDEVFILSNNHVLANSNEARIGDPIVQPGIYDGGTDKDVIGKLSDFVRINFTGEPTTCPYAKAGVKIVNGIAKVFKSKVRIKGFDTTETANLVDAAIAKPINEQDVLHEILGIENPKTEEVPKGVAEGRLGLKVQKSGRTTGITTGIIKQVSVSVNVSYGGDRMGLMEDQILTDGMSEGGDSGSVVLDMNNNVVGLLFAGSKSVTIINRIQNVFSSLGVSL